MTLMALEIRHHTGRKTVWAFDLVEEFTRAAWTCHRNRVQCRAHHWIDPEGQPHEVGTRGDEYWLQASGGLNDAYEVERCLFERGELQRPEAFVA